MPETDLYALTRPHRPPPRKPKIVPIATTEEGMKRTGQTYGRTMIVETGGWKLRVVIHYDSYPQQSRYLVETWTPNGWALVHRIHGDDPSIDLPSGYSNPEGRLDPPAAKPRLAAVVALTHQLIDVALAVLGGAR